MLLYHRVSIDKMGGLLWFVEVRLIGILIFCLFSYSNMISIEHIGQQKWNVSHASCEKGLDGDVS